jgi:hypothetical protein
MSGPIVRKYGFPNFEQIFGKRELEHGADADEAPEPEESKADGKPGSDTPQDPTQAGSSQPGAKRASK